GRLRYQGVVSCEIGVDVFERSQMVGRILEFTHNTMGVWEKKDDMVCAFCKSLTGSHNHLFFECDYPKKVWSELKCLARLDHAPFGWVALLEFMLARPVNKSVWSIIRRLLMAAKMVAGCVHPLKDSYGQLFEKFWILSKDEICEKGTSKERKRGIAVGDNELQGSYSEGDYSTYVTLGVGIPNTVVSTTINKVCASEMKATMLAAQSIQLGINDVVMASGMESMSNVPKYVTDARQDTPVDCMVKDGLWDTFNNFKMGNCSEIFVDMRQGLDMDVGKKGLVLHKCDTINNGSNDDYGDWMTRWDEFYERTTITTVGHKSQHGNHLRSWKT
nr:acetyl-CoA acetyltransferase, cytosolic 1-like [Tanacetum cinerariifolium]